MSHIIHKDSLVVAIYRKTVLHIYQKYLKNITEIENKENHIYQFNRMYESSEKKNKQTRKTDLRLGPIYLDLI